MQGSIIDTREDRKGKEDVSTQICQAGSASCDCGRAGRRAATAEDVALPEKVTAVFPEAM